MQKFFFEDDGFIPNSRFPVLLIYRAIDFRRMHLVESEAMLKACARETDWNLEWLWTVYKGPHYHSTTHEALVVCRGTATLCLGGHRLGNLVCVRRGDAIVIPAGVAHQAVKRSRNFLVFGLYPIGAEPYDMRYCRKKERSIALSNLILLGEPPEFKL